MLKSFPRLVLTLILSLSSLSACYDDGSVPKELACKKGDVSPGNICQDGIWIKNPDKCVEKLELSLCQPAQFNGDTLNRCGVLANQPCGVASQRTVTVNCGSCSNDRLECKFNFCVPK